MSPARWRRADESDDLAHFSGYQEYPIFYARIYTARQGFAYSDTNQLVKNLKIDLSQTHRLQHKTAAIERFARETADFVRHNKTYHFDFVPMPPSKRPGHVDYDARIEEVARRVVALCPENSRHRPLLHVTAQIEPFHEREGGRSWQELYDVLAIAPDGATPESEKEHLLVVFDDVLTTGAHYEAARRRLLEVYPDQKVIGICWAKVEWLREEGEGGK